MKQGYKLGEDELEGPPMVALKRAQKTIKTLCLDNTVTGGGGGD